MKFWDKGFRSHEGLLDKAKQVNSIFSAVGYASDVLEAVSIEYSDRTEARILKIVRMLRNEIDELEVDFEIKASDYMDKLQDGNFLP